MKSGRFSLSLKQEMKEFSSPRCGDGWVSQTNTGQGSLAGSRRKGVIKRQRELHEGRWTYRLISLKKQITIDSINDCPCMPCENIEKCDPGLFVSPILCEKLTNWLNAKTNVEISLEESNDKNV